MKEQTVYPLCFSCDLPVVLWPSLSSLTCCLSLCLVASTAISIHEAESTWCNNISSSFISFQVTRQLIGSAIWPLCSLFPHAYNCPVTQVVPCNWLCFMFVAIWHEFKASAALCIPWHCDTYVNLFLELLISSLHLSPFSLFPSLSLSLSLSHCHLSRGLPVH